MRRCVRLFRTKYTTAVNNSVPHLVMVRALSGVQLIVVTGLSRVE